MTSPLSWRRPGAPAHDRAVFVDRDGVLNRWIPGSYALRPSDIVFNDDAIRALGAIDRTRFALVIASNQSCVGRGLIDTERLIHIMGYVAAGMSERGTQVDAWYCCVHAPGDGCGCRKPGPGLLTAAAADLGLRLRDSYFIGDQPTDMEAARRAGVHGLPVRPDDACDVASQVGRIQAEAQHAR